MHGAQPFTSPLCRSAPTHLCASDYSMLVPGHRGGEAPFLSWVLVIERTVVQLTVGRLLELLLTGKFLGILHTSIKPSQAEKQIMST